VNKKIVFTLEQITPETARDMLSRSEQAQQDDPSKRQRTTKTRVVSAIRTEVKAENFHATHQAIAVDPTGWVFDGKHRITAISQEATGAHLYVARYASEEYAKFCMRFLDIGTKRDLGGTLEACGKIDRLGDVVVAAVRAIWALTHADCNRDSIPSNDLDRMVQRYAPEVLHLHDLAPKFRGVVLGSFAFLRELGIDVDGILVRIYAGTGLSDQEAKLRDIITRGTPGGTYARRDHMGKILRLMERIQSGEKIGKTMSVDVSALVTRWETRRRP
jgi:hypothetical protein